MAQNVHQSPSLSVRPPFASLQTHQGHFASSLNPEVLKGCRKLWNVQKKISVLISAANQRKARAVLQGWTAQVGPAGQTLTDVPVSVSTPSGETEGVAEPVHVSVLGRTPDPPASLWTRSPGDRQKCESHRR